MGDLGGNERQGDDDAHDANEPPAGTSARPTTRRAPYLLRHPRRTEGVRLKATSGFGPHHGRREIIFGHPRIFDRLVRFIRTAHGPNVRSRSDI
jgi:hypothetical protein